MSQIDERHLPEALRQEFREAIQRLPNARRAEAWDTLFKCVRWALAVRTDEMSGCRFGRGA